MKNFGSAENIYVKSEDANNCNMYKRYYDKARRDNISPEQTVFSKKYKIQLQESVSQKRRISLYAERFLISLGEAYEEMPASVVLFDQDGCIIDVFSPKTVDMPNVKILEPGTIWRFDELGPNAVTVGNIERKRISTKGEDNYNVFLKDYSIYYAPISMKPHIIQSEPADTIEYGGIGVIANIRDDDWGLKMLSSAIVNYAVLNMQFYVRTHYLYDQSAGGVFTVDMMVEKGKYILSHYNSALFDILDIPPRDIAFQPLSMLIEQNAENQEFWNLIKNMTYVKEKNISLKIGDSIIPCLITTDPFRQPNINVCGMNIVVNTPLRGAKEVSRKIGNNARITFDNIVGECGPMKGAIRRGKLLAATDSNILILGESGVGKDVFAQAVHNHSKRRDKPFIVVNCGAIPRDLITSELFGYEGGSFTGAKRQGNIGKFELANGGTIFLDEIGELPLDLQANLLRVVEQKSLMRIGGTRQIDVDVKVISATNADIPRMIDHRLFRADLYYRLSTTQLYLPPLRERGGDIVLLAEYFIRKCSDRQHKEVLSTLSDDASHLLQSLPWHGNVRELQNLVESIVSLYPEEIITTDIIMENLSPAYNQYKELPAALETAAPPKKKAIRKNNQGRRLNITKEMVESALAECNDNRSAAAGMLGVARRTLYRYIEQFEIQQ